MIIVYPTIKRYATQAGFDSKTCTQCNHPKLLASNFVPTLAFLLREFKARTISRVKAHTDTQACREGLHTDTGS